MSSVYLDRKYINLLASRLSNFKWKSEKLANCRCPLCGDSARNKRKARGYFYLNKNNTGFSYKCHNCSMGLPFRELLKGMDSTLYSEYAYEDFADKKSNNFSSVTPKENKTGTNYVLPYKSNIEDSPIAKKYLIERQIPSKYYFEFYYAKCFKSFMDAYFPSHGKTDLKDDARLIIPFFDKDKKVFAVTGRSLDNSDRKYITIKFDERKAVYGLDRYKPENEGFVVEGPIDSLFLHNCIAMGGSALFEIEEFVDKGKTTLIFDNQPRNKEIIASMSRAIEKNFKVFFWPKLLKEKDINDLILSGHDTYWVHELISKNTASGLDARLKLTEWSKK